MHMKNDKLSVFDCMLNYFYGILEIFKEERIGVGLSNWESNHTAGGSLDLKAILGFA